MTRPWAFCLLLSTLAASAAWTPAGEPPAKAAEATWPLWDGKETVAEYAKRAGLEPTVTLKLKEKVALELVLIPAGKFMMGSPETEKDRQPNEGPQHEVTVSKPFYMGKYEVTQEQYEAVMARNPSHFRGARLPVETVSWAEAAEFCKAAKSRVCVGRDRKATEAEAGRIEALIRKLGDADFDVRQAVQTDLANLGAIVLPYMKELLAKADADLETKAGAAAVLDRIESAMELPTEAQWEYACRAAMKTRFHSGDAEEDLKAVGWCDANSAQKTHPVGEKKPNGWGLYDMHGNVFEWCQDFCSDKYEAGAVVDPKGPANGTARVLRGGSWGNGPGGCRSACRDGDGPEHRNDCIGFRVVVAVLSRTP